MATSKHHPSDLIPNQRPAWQTDELSQEWVQSSPSPQPLPPRNNSWTHKNAVKLSKDLLRTSSSSMRVLSNSRIPVSAHSSLVHNRSGSSFQKVLQSSSSSIPNSRLSSNSQSNRSPGSSIVLIQNPPQDDTPPWIKAAVDGMVSDVLGKRPSQLQKIFHPDQARPQSSAPIDNHPLAKADAHRSSLGSTSATHEPLPSAKFDFSVPRSITSLRSISFPDSAPTSSNSSSDHQNSFFQPSLPPEDNYDNDNDDDVDDDDDALAEQQVLIPAHLDRLRFVRDSRLDEIVEETEPSSSFESSRASELGQLAPIDERSLSDLPSEMSRFEHESSQRSGSLPSSTRPPSLPFAQPTPVLDPQHRLERLRSQSPCCPSEHASEQQANEPGGSTKTQKIFRFTYDTFARKHLSRLAEEIDGLSTYSASALLPTGPLKIKSILGSPGEEVTDSSTSLGLAHSTPPGLLFGPPATTAEKRVVDAGRTPFRPVTNMSARWRDEQRWAASFVEPSPYARASLGGVAPEAREPGPDRQPKRPVLADMDPDCPPRQSSKRIRLAPSPPRAGLHARRVEDSLVLSTERHARRAAHTRPARAHPMVVFKPSAPVDQASFRPAPQTHPQIVVRDRLAEARALMDRIRAKAGTGVEVEPGGAPAGPEPAGRPASQTSSSSLTLHEQDVTGQEQDMVWDRQTGSIIAHDDDDGLAGSKSKDKAGRDTAGELVWTIGIDEDGALSDREEERLEGPTSESEDGYVDVGVMQRKLATRAAASLRQALADGPGCQRAGSAGSQTSAALGRRQFATQPVVRDGRGEESGGVQQRVGSGSTAGSTMTGRPATVASGKVKAGAKLGLMTILPGDVEELLQHARVGKMVFDGRSRKWVKARSQSEVMMSSGQHGLGGSWRQAVEEGCWGEVEVEERVYQQQQVLEGEGEVESSEESDVFRDIESLTSGFYKRDDGLGCGPVGVAVEGSAGGGGREEKEGGKLGWERGLEGDGGTERRGERGEMERGERLGSLSEKRGGSQRHERVALPRQGWTGSHRDEERMGSQRREERVGSQRQEDRTGSQRLERVELSRQGWTGSQRDEERMGSQRREERVGLQRNEERTDSQRDGEHIVSPRPQERVGSERQEERTERHIHERVGLQRHERMGSQREEEHMASQRRERVGSERRGEWQDSERRPERMGSERRERTIGLTDQQAPLPRSQPRSGGPPASTPPGQRVGVGRGARPKSVLKTGSSPSSSVLSQEQEACSPPSAKPSRSVSFQDGRKNGKIVGLASPGQENEEDLERTPRAGRVGMEGAGLEGQSVVLMSCTKKVRRKTSLSQPGTPTCEQSSSTTTMGPRNLITPNNNTNNDETTTECSFGLNYERLVRIITDLEPFEPFWSSIKNVDLSKRKLESVVRLKEILPELDMVDLHSNELTYLTGLPNSIRMLIVHSNQLNDMCSFSELYRLEKLDLCRNFLSGTFQLSSLKHLRELKLDENLIGDLTGLIELDGLIKLSIKGNRLKKINFESTRWTRLEVLNLDRNQIGEISGLHHLSSMYHLNLDRNQLYSLEIEQPILNLRVLRVSENRLEKLDVSQLVNLRTLYIDNNDLIEIVGAGRLRKLENLSARDQRGGELTLPLKQVRDVKRLYLGGNPLGRAFPAHQFFNLQYLELAMCRCERLPADLAQLVPNVRVVNLNYNFLCDLAPLAGLARLTTLTVVGSRVRALGRALLGVLESLPELAVLDLRQNPVCQPFYAPMLLTGSGAGEPDGPAHLNQYQIKASSHQGWQAVDDRFRKALPNEFYLRRMTYRALVIGACAKTLKSFDGIEVGEAERKKTSRFLRGLGRKLEKQAKNSSGAATEGGGGDGRALEEGESGTGGSGGVRGGGEKSEESCLVERSKY